MPKFTYPLSSIYIYICIKLYAIVVSEVKQSLMKETASSFSAKLQENMDALVGHGHYTQQAGDGRRPGGGENID